MPKSWISNTVPSLPAPPPKAPEVDLGGFVFTGGGIAHPVNANLLEEATLAIFAPDESGKNLLANLTGASGLPPAS